MAVTKRNQTGGTLDPGKTHSVSLLQPYRLVTMTNRIQTDLKTTHSTLTNRMFKRNCHRIWAWLGNLGESLRKWDFTPDWMLSESGGNSVTSERLNGVRVGGQRRGEKAVIGKAEADALRERRGSIHRGFHSNFVFVVLCHGLRTSLFDALGDGRVPWNNVAQMGLYNIKASSQMSGAASSPLALSIYQGFENRNQQKAVIALLW